VIVVVVPAAKSSPAELSSVSAELLKTTATVSADLGYSPKD
jgi:hypothetical protein